jgi:hypothetical protein
MHLYNASLFFGTVIVLLVITIYCYLLVKKKRFFSKARISDKLDDCIGAILIEDATSPEVEMLIAEIKALLINPLRKQFAIDLLINTKKNLLGQAAQNIVNLYERLDLKAESIRKFHSLIWHQRAGGIYELYMMNQRDMQSPIAQHTNSPNETVRVEAQVATLGFSGFEGLSFLNSLTYPVTEWQQIKLLEQLHLISTAELKGLPQWIKSSNQDVVLFALKLTDTYQQLGVHEEVAASLQNDAERIRYQAIQTLGRIAGEGTRELFRMRYAAETSGNKMAILKQMAVIGDMEDLPFLQRVATTETDEDLQVEAVRAMASCCKERDELFLELKFSGRIAESIVRQIEFEFGP